MLPVACLCMPADPCACRQTAATALDSVERLRAMLRGSGLASGLKPVAHPVSGSVSGRAWKPKGLFLRHALRSMSRRLRASPPASAMLRRPGAAGCGASAESTQSAAWWTGTLLEHVLSRGFRASLRVHAGNEQQPLVPPLPLVAAGGSSAAEVAARSALDYGLLHAARNHAISVGVAAAEAVGPDGVSANAGHQACYVKVTD